MAKSKRKEEQALRNLLFERQGGFCHYCGLTMRPPHGLPFGPISKRAVTLEHLKPQSQGGETSVQNCVAACRECNEARGDMSLKKWDAILVAKFEKAR